ncbi:helix-turn-helix transcriptional regulator [Streptosporangiaceae bacterium NEAU-GS5]|nr:helix-turn-helix transcriptional regulator [Streptosporangiaceae bacterium NEAU-GS5]
MEGDVRESLSDPKAMRALAHPARLAMLTRLGSEGPATATEVAEAAGVTPSAASYHLRMLAKYGFVEDAPPRGDGRERLWKSVGHTLAVETLPDDQPEVRAAKDLLVREFRKAANDEADRALADLDRESPEWRESVMFYRMAIRVNAAELGDLAKKIEALLEPYAPSRRGKDEAPDDARVAEAQINLFPRAERRVPGLPTEDHGAG